MLCGAARARHGAHPDRATGAHRLRRASDGDRACSRSRPLQSETLVHNLVELDDLPPGLRDLILAKAEGNPFFVEEIVRSLIDLGGLARDRSTSGYRVTERATAISLPDTLVGVIMARVDRLDDDLKQVLRLAAVIGRSFFYRLLAAISEAERELDESLAGLQARELVLERARDPELEYVFKHALVQEATYESILKQRRRELHGKVARSIELLFADRLEDFSGLLAYHYTQAEDWEKAQEYLFKAGDQAASIAADAEALEHYERAMAAYSQAFGDSWEPTQRANLERKIGEAFYRRGEHERAREHLIRALATLGRPFPDTPGAMRRAVVGQLMRQVLHRLFPWFQPRPLPADAVRAAEERCRVYYTLVWIGAFGDTRTTWLLGVLLCLNEGERAGLGWATSWGSSWIAMAPAHRAVPTALSAPTSGARVCWRNKEGWDLQLAQAALVAGMYAYWIDGDFAAARAVPAAVGRPVSRARRDTSVGHCHRGGHLRAGRERRAGSSSRDVQGDDSTRGGDRRSSHRGLGAGLGGRAALPGRRPRGGGGRACVSTVDAMVEMMDYRIGAKVAGRLATCLMAQGRLKEAQVLLDEHHARLRERGHQGRQRQQRDPGPGGGGPRRRRAVSRRRREARVSRRPDGPAELRSSKRRWTRPRSSLPLALRGTCEWLRGRPRNAEKWWRRSLDHAEKLGTRYEGALTELGDRPPAR